MRPRGGRAIVCPDGPAYRIEASGLRAEVIVNAMMKCGMSAKKLQQWESVVVQCKAESEKRNATANVARGLAAMTVKKLGIREDPLPLDNTRLARYSTGLFNGEGSSCGFDSNGKRYPRIQVAMCDRDALEPVGRWWGVKVLPRPGKAKVCADGPAYRIVANGKRAEAIVNEMIKHDLSIRKIEQWRKVLSRCGGGA